MSAPGTAPLPAALLLLLAAPLAAPAAAETFSGQVLPPAAAARVELWPACANPTTGLGEGPAAKPLATVRLGKDGRFRIAAPDGEPLRLRVEADGYLPAERSVGSDPELPPLRLRPAETLELALAGPDGQPLAGLALQIHPAAAAKPGKDGWRTPVQHATSGPDGRALFRRAAGDSPGLFVASPRLLAIRKLGEGSPQRLVLAPGRPVTLKATDPRGRPVPAARVLLPDGFEIGRTGADGRLELAAPAEDLVLTVATGAGLEADVGLGPGTGTTLDAALLPALEVAGRVVDRESGQPIAGSHLAAGCRAVTRSAADGSFRLAVPRTENALIARADGYLQDALSLEEMEERAASGASPLTFALRPAAALAVQVVDEAGKPVEGARVSAQVRPYAQVGSAAATTGAAGRARLSVAAGAQFEVTAEHEGFAAARGTARTPAPGEPAAGGSPGTDRELRLVLGRGATALGRLTTGEGEPLAGSVVLQPDPGDGWSLSRRVKPHRQAAAGPDGRFELRHLAPGRYRLTARAPGRVEALRSIEVAAGEPRVDLGDLPLDPGAALEGRVLDERDRPLAGATVAVWEGRGEVLHSETGADGAFRLADLEPGRVRFQVKREGYVEANLERALPSAEPVTVRLRPARTLAGRVTGPRGEPAAGAEIRSFVIEQQGHGRTLANSSDLAQADHEGRFRAGGLEPGSLNLRVEAPGYLGRELQVEIPADRDPAPLEIALETGAVVEGRVLAAGRPVADAEVWAHAMAGAGPVLQARIPTDGAGRYHLAGLETGLHIFFAASDDGRRAQQELEVQPGTQQLDLHLTMGGLTGRVVDGAGQPVAGAELRLVWPGGEMIELSAADGSFAFPGVAPGTYHLTAHHLEAGAAELPQVRVGDAPLALPDLVLEPDTETAVVAGRLTGVARRDLAWARVEARLAAPGEAPPMPASETRRNVQVAEDGSYGLAGLAPGIWELEAHAGSRRPVRREVRLAAGDRATVDFAFTGGATLAGRVLLDGQPAGGLQVRLEPEGGATATGPDGTFALHDLAPRVYDLQIAVHPGGDWSQTLEVGEEGRQLEVNVPAGALAGRVHSPAGPVAGALVTAEGRDGVGPTAVTGDDGAFHLRLLPGRYRVRVRAEGAADLETDVDIAAGSEVQVDLPLP